MAIPNVTFTVSFSSNEARTQGAVRVTDTTNWASYGIAPADVEIGWGYTAPDGNTYKVPLQGAAGNILPAVQLWSEFPAPQGVDGRVQQGDYTVTVIAFVSGAVDPGAYEPDPVVASLCTDYPVTKLTTIADCLRLVVSATDDTNWDALGWTLSSRAMTLQYPSVTMHADITGAGPTVSTAGEPVFTGKWTATCEVTVTKNGYTVTVETIKQFDVACDLDGCKMSCMMNNKQSALNLARGEGNPMLATQLEADLREMTTLALILQMSIQCGDSTLVDEVIKRFKVVSSRNAYPNPSDCGCCTECGEPRQVVPIWGGGGSQWTPLAGNQITITPGSGTYTFSVDQSFIDYVNALRNTVVTAGAGISVTPSGPSGSPPTMTYQVTNTNPATDSVRWKLRWDIRANTFAPTSPVVVGSTFTGVGITMNPFAAGPFGTFYRVENFIASGTVQFMAKVTVASRELTRYAVSNYPYAKVVEAVQADFSFVGNPNSFAFGLSLTLAALPGGVVGWCYPMSWYDTYLAFIELEFEVYKL